MSAQCSLVLDEMRLISRFYYDPSSGQVRGSVTLNGYRGPAPNALVFMVGGKRHKTLLVFTSVTQRYPPGVSGVCNFYPLLLYHRADIPLEADSGISFHIFID